MSSELSELSDAELHTRWAADDRDAGHVLADRYLERLFAFARRMGFTIDEAGDLVHDVFVKVKTAPYTPRKGVSYWSWLSVLARRTAIQQQQQPELDPELVAVGRVTTSRGRLRRLEMLARIEDMPEGLRDVLARATLGYTASEIAAELEMDPGAVHMRLHRARKWLRDRLELRNKKRRR